MKEDIHLKEAQVLTQKFAKIKGRQPRIMLAKIGKGDHDREAKVVATSFADIGFDVDIGPLFQTTEEVAKQAVENDAHFVGIYSLAEGHKILIPAVIEALKQYGREDINVVVGGKISTHDYSFLKAQGVLVVFAPEHNISQAAIVLLNHLFTQQ